MASSELSIPTSIVPAGSRREQSLTMDISLIDDELLRDLRAMNKAAVDHIKTRLTDPNVDPEAKDRLAIAALPKIVQQASMMILARADQGTGGPKSNRTSTLEELLAESNTVIEAGVEAGQSDTAQLETKQAQEDS